VLAQIKENPVPQIVYLLMLSGLWSAVGALVFFARARISRSQRLCLTIVTSLVFGAVGFVDMSSILHAASNPAVIAKAQVK
jgi:hypothetical protein